MWSIVLERIGGYFRNEVRIGLFLGRWLIRVRLFCFGGFIVSKVSIFVSVGILYGDVVGVFIRRCVGIVLYSGLLWGCGG